MASDTTIQARGVAFLHRRFAYKPDNAERVDDVATAVVGPAEVPRAEQVLRRFAAADDTPIAYADADRQLLVWLVVPRRDVLDWIRTHAPEELPPDMR